MSLGSARNQLKSSVTTLMLHWDEVRAHWDDPVSRAFERDHLLQLEPAARAAVAAMEKMGDLMAKAQRDCS